MKLLSLAAALVLVSAGVIVTGGTVLNATRNGTNLQGKTIEGGRR